LHLVAPIIPVCFQHFPLAPGDSVQLKRNLWPTIRPGRQLRRSRSRRRQHGGRQLRSRSRRRRHSFPASPAPGGCLLYVTDKRHRGKPPLANRLKRDRIVAYVQHLQRTKPGRKLSRYVEAAADFFKCDERTVWNAWTEYRPRPYKTAFPDVEWGEPHLVTTVRIGPIDLGPSRSTAG
jgi:hypothetical protein